MGPESDGFGTHDFKGNTEFGHLAFSHAVLAVQPFEVTEGMEGEQTPETDLTRHHQDLEEGDRFESSDLKLERCCFLALLRCRHTVVSSFMEGTEIAFSWIGFL